MNSEQKAIQASEHLSSVAEPPIRFGIILGTGSGVVAQKITVDHEIEYADIPNFPRSTALGHKGSLILGKLGSVPVIAMNGRFHLYEGHHVDDATLVVRVMRNLGVESLFITNAAGGLNPKFSSGDVMIIDSHIDLMCRTSALTSVKTTEGRPSQRTDIYSSAMAESARAYARDANFEIQTGVYAGLLGPNYETRAEYRLLRRIGADVAGMSTIPEVYVAASIGMKVLGLSVVTNVAKPDVLEKTSGQEVVDAAQLAAPRICGTICQTITDMTSSP